MNSAIKYILYLVLLNNILSACQSSKYYYLHFNDKKSGTFYFSDIPLYKSIDTCIVKNDTLHIILSTPKIIEEKNRDYYRRYYCKYRRPQLKYTEKFPICNLPSNSNCSAIVLENYYCTRIFKRKNRHKYIQDSSVIFSSYSLEL